MNKIDFYPIKLAFSLLIFSFLCSMELWAQNDTTRLNEVQTLDEVVVTGSRAQVSRRNVPMSISVVPRHTIERSFQPSLMPMLSEEVPGLFVTQRGVMGYGVSTGAAGAMRMRGIGGSPTTALLVLIDGRPQYMGLMGHPLADTYQSLFAERVEAVAGPASMLYGSNAMGGVVNIVTRQATNGTKTRARMSYGSYNTLSAEAGSTLRKGKFGGILTASYNRTDGHRSNSEFSQYNVYAKTNYNFSEHWRAYADVNVAQFWAANPGTLSAPIIDNDANIFRGTASAAVENDYGRKLSGAARVYYNWGRHRINDGYSVSAMPLDYRFHSRDYMAGVSLYENVSFFDGNTITFGLDWQHVGGEAWNKFDNGNRTELVDKALDEAAAYVNFHQNLWQKLTLDMGLRYDYHSLCGGEWVPQGGISYSPTGQLTFKALIGKGFRNPTIREMYLFPPQNPDLLPERLMNYELSVLHSVLQHKLTYGVNIFYINGDNLIQTQRIGGKPLNVNTGAVRNAGVEATVRYRFPFGLTTLGNYAYLYMQHSILAAPAHKLNVKAEYSHKRWYAATNVQYVAGLCTALPTASEPANTTHFVLWNASAAFRLCSWAELFARVDNMLNQKYEINAGYPMPGITMTGGVNFDI